MNKFKELILLISENITNKEDKKNIIDNIDLLVDKYILFSKIIKNISMIVLNYNISYNEKIKQIQKIIKLNHKQTQKLLNNMNISTNTYKQFGGVSLEKNNWTTNINTNVEKKIIIIY